VDGRQIFDSIIFSDEVVDSLKATKSIGMLIKLDMSKSFDKISWKYISDVLLSFGFHLAWIKWVMALISFSFFFLLINGSPSTHFIPSRGIRQGDPISPFLFFIMTEGLDRNLKVVISSQKIHVLNLHKFESSLSQNQFVDDTMFMGIPSAKEARSFKRVLDDFMEDSCTSVNHLKY
jgi:hypothetical protein